MQVDSTLASRIILAKHWAIIPPRRPRGVMIHVTVNDPRTPAANVARVFKQGDRVASANYVVGLDEHREDVEIIQCVPESGRPCAAQGANETDIHVEIVGQVTMTSSEWIATKQFAAAAALAGDILYRNALPAVLVDAEGMLAGAEGLRTHWECTEATRLAHERKLIHSPLYVVDAHGHPTSSGHTDPYRSAAGPRADVDQFDLEVFYGMVLNSLPPDYPTRLAA